MTNQEKKLFDLLISGNKNFIHQALSLMDVLGMGTTQKDSELIREAMDYLSENSDMDNDFRKRWRLLLKEQGRFKGGIVKDVIDLVEGIVQGCWDKYMKRDMTSFAMHSEGSFIDPKAQTISFQYGTGGYYNFEMDADHDKAYYFIRCLNHELKKHGIILAYGKKDIDENINKRSFSVMFEVDLNALNFNKLASTRSSTMRRLTKRQASQKLDMLHAQLTNKTTKSNGRRSSRKMTARQATVELDRLYNETFGNKTTSRRSSRKMTARQAQQELDRAYSRLQRRARFSEGEKGRKEFVQWKSEQSEDFQEEWDENTDKNKKASRKMTPKQASRALDRLHAKTFGTDRKANRKPSARKMTKRQATQKLDRLHSRLTKRSR